MTPSAPDATVEAGTPVAEASTATPTGAAEVEASWWAGTGPITRAVVVVLGVLVSVNLGLGLLGPVVGEDPGGPSGSSFATADTGVAAWSELLASRGVEVDALRAPIGEAALPAGGTVVVVDPDVAPTAADAAALRAHLRDGGRVVLVGAGGADHLAALTGRDPLWTAEGATTVSVVPGAPGLDGVRTLEGEGRGRLADPTGLEVLAAGPDGAAVVVGDGRLVAVADASVVWNRGLARADNAALAIALAGDGPVAFAEAEHGYGEATGVAAFPVRWRIAVAALVVVALLAMWSLGRRLGPPDVPDRKVAPPRRAYVDAVAAALSRTTPSPRPAGGAPAPDDTPRSPP